MTTRTRTLTAVGLWIAVIGASMLADRWVATTAVAHGIPSFLKSQYTLYQSSGAGGSDTGPFRIALGLGDLLKMPGEYWFTGVLAIVATICYAKSPQWHAGAFVLICGLLSGVNGLIKWFTGRARPFKMLASKQDVPLDPFHFQPFFHGISGLFGTSNLCFPSGHAALAFANAAALAILFPRVRWVGYTIATLTAAERFLETAHYFSDTVAAAALGIGGAHILAWAFAGRSEDDPPLPVSPAAAATQG